MSDAVLPIHPSKVLARLLEAEAQAGEQHVAVLMGEDVDRRNVAFTLLCVPMSKATTPGAATAEGISEHAITAEELDARHVFVVQPPSYGDSVYHFWLTVDGALAGVN